MHRYINIFGKTIPSYGVMLFAAVFLAGAWALIRAQKRNIAWEDMMVVTAAAVGSALIFGCALYISITYTPQMIWKYISSGDFSFLFNSGIVFYGGLIGGVVGGTVAARLMKMNFGTVEEIIIPCLPLGHAIGRIGCILAGCCYGFEYHGIFAVKNEYAPGGECFPIQVAEVLFNMIIMHVLMRLLRKRRKSGVLLFTYLAMYAVMRFAAEFFRADAVRGAFLAFSTSQWISLLLFVSCAVFYFYGIVFEKNKVDKKV